MQVTPILDILTSNHSDSAVFSTTVGLPLPSRHFFPQEPDGTGRPPVRRDPWRAALRLGVYEAKLLRWKLHFLGTQKGGLGTWSVKARDPIPIGIVGKMRSGINRGQRPALSAVIYLASTRTTMSSPTQTKTPYALAGLPKKDALTKQFVGQPLEALRTPAMVIDRSIFQQNCVRMLQNATEWGATLRSHLKTHKVPLLQYQDNLLM